MQIIQATTIRSKPYTYLSQCWLWSISPLIINRHLWFKVQAVQNNWGLTVTFQLFLFHCYHSIMKPTSGQETSATLKSVSSIFLWISDTDQIADLLIAVLCISTNTYIHYTDVHMKNIGPTLQNSGLAHAAACCVGEHHEWRHFEGITYPYMEIYLSYYLWCQIPKPNQVLKEKRLC